MRTTLTLDPDVADALKEQAGRENKPFKQVVHDLNLLVYAYNSDAPLHDETRVWWGD